MIRSAMEGSDCRFDYAGDDWESRIDWYFAVKARGKFRRWVWFPFFMELIRFLIPQTIRQNTEWCCSIASRITDSSLTCRQVAVCKRFHSAVVSDRIRIIQGLLNLLVIRLAWWPLLVFGWYERFCIVCRNRIAAAALSKNFMPTDRARSIKPLCNLSTLHTLVPGRLRKFCCITWIFEISGLKPVKLSPGNRIH